jgi:hypothetical protein
MAKLYYILQLSVSNKKHPMGTSERDGASSRKIPAGIFPCPRGCCLLLTLSEIISPFFIFLEILRILEIDHDGILFHISLLEDLLDYLVF